MFFIVVDFFLSAVFVGGYLGRCDTAHQYFGDPKDGGTCYCKCSFTSTDFSLYGIFCLLTYRIVGIFTIIGMFGSISMVRLFVFCAIILVSIIYLFSTLLALLGYFFIFIAIIVVSIIVVSIIFVCLVSIVSIFVLCVSLSLFALLVFLVNY